MEEKIIFTRVKAVLDSLGISARQFCFSINKSEGWVTSLRYSKREAIPSDVLSKILEVYPMVNRDYILEGKGSPLLDETNTLDDFPDYEPEPGDYKELCMAYRRDLAEMREEAKRLRESYLQLLETHNKMMENYSILQAACLKAGIEPVYRDTLETKKA